MHDPNKIIGAILFSPVHMHSSIFLACRTQRIPPTFSLPLSLSSSLTICFSFVLQPCTLVNILLNVLLKCANRDKFVRGFVKKPYHEQYELSNAVVGPCCIIDVAILDSLGAPCQIEYFWFTSACWWWVIIIIIGGGGGGGCGDMVVLYLFFCCVVIAVCVCEGRGREGGLVRTCVCY